MGKPLSVTLNIYCRKVLVFLCATAMALPPPAFGMMRGKHVDHYFEDSVTYAFKAVFHTEEDGTLSTHPHPPTAARSQACLTHQGHLEPLRECFEGEDQRLRIPQPDKWPYTIHGQMESRSAAGIPFSGSGVLVGPHHFLTAAHCVYDGRKMHGWARSLTVYPALNDASAPFGAVRGVKAYVYQQWVDFEDPDFDMALVVLDNSIGNETGWAGMMALPEEELRDRKVHVTGYPGDPDKRNQLWTMEDTLDWIDDETFSYKMHTSGGQSGGGIWIKQLASPVVVGVHTMGYVGRNFGVRLSKQKLQDIIAWMEETGEKQGRIAFPVVPLDTRSSHGSMSSPISIQPLVREPSDAAAQFQLGRNHEEGLDGYPKDDREAVKCYGIAARQGHAEAQFKIGVMYAEGRGGLQKNEAEAARFYRRAADQGHTRAQYSLGRRYAENKSVENAREAVKWFQLAADQGSREAQNELKEARFNLGWMYENGQGVTKDETEAVKWYRLAAAQGHAEAQFKVGAMYKDGRGGLQKNEAETVRFCQLAANQGSAAARYVLAQLYENGRGGLGRDDHEAFMLYKVAAEQGYADAQYCLGRRYAEGKSVENEREAVKWLQLAANQGHAAAQNSLGVIYVTGRGVAKNEREAVRLYQLAAEQGHAMAQYNLGWMYQNGQDISKEECEAAKWYRLAAEQRHMNAQNALGQMYEYGQGGLLKDDVEAARLYGLASDQEEEQKKNGWMYPPMMGEGATCNLAAMYAEGRGVMKDERKARELWQKAGANLFLELFGVNDDGELQQSALETLRIYRLSIIRKDAEAQYRLGNMYRYGRGGLQTNGHQAAYFYKLAAEQSHAEAQYELGVSYEEGWNTGGRYDPYAVCFYIQAATQGHATAQYRLGVRYENGRGVEKSESEAVKWYRKAAEQGHAEAQYQLGRMYADGRGVAGDDREAVKWYRKAAEQGHTGVCHQLLCICQYNRYIEIDQETASLVQNLAEQGNVEAQFNLGDMYLCGRGVASDGREAVKWYRKAAEQGHAEAQYQLGWMYKCGGGDLKEDNRQAAYWYRKAAAQGNANARSALKELNKCVIL